MGIDGGGTTTRCLVGDDKSVLGEGRGGACNIVRAGEACARNSLTGAIHEACVQAGVSPHQITRTCAGLSGAGDDGIASLAQRLLIEVISGAIEVIGDMEVALESAFGGGPGVIVIAGTGSIAYGRNTQGEIARAGGWGRVISDEGSGHWIGQQAIRSALREHDANGQSNLLEQLMATLAVTNVNDLAVLANSDPLPEFGPLFPLVVEIAGKGDAVATGVLTRAGHELATTGNAVVRRLFIEEEALVATHGGVFEGSACVKDTFHAELLKRCPRVRNARQEVNPVLGALERARREFGVWHNHA